MPTAFLITPFSPASAGNEDPEIYAAVQDAIEAAARAAGVELVHPARMQAPGLIIDQVRQAILEADIILAVLTGQNPNVFYELGTAAEKARRPPVLIVRSMEEVPFDVRHFRFWTYAGPGELARLQDSLTEAIRQGLASTPRGGPQPILEVRTIQNGERLLLNYRSRAIPLLGRETELAYLRAFLASQRRFLWQSFHGPGGSGKSRLALELCLEANPEWYAGFLPPNNGFLEEWQTWRPTRPTLVVIDEVEQRSREAGIILEALSLREDELDDPVRVLLLGRERSRRLERIFNVDPFEWEALYEPSAFGPPRPLGPLDETQAAQIVSRLAGDSLPGARPSGDLSAPGGIFTEDPALRLPLFAALAGLATAGSGRALRWDRTTVTRYVLERDRSQRWQSCTVEDENLLAYLAITGAQPVEFLVHPPAPDLFPGDPQIALEHNRIMAGHDGPLLMPLRPAPLGELFLLELLGEAAVPETTADRGHRLVETAGPALTEFIITAMSHYPEHPGTPRLLAAEVPAFDAAVPMVLGFGVPILMDSISEFVSSGETALAKAFAEAARLLDRRGYADMEIWGGWGEAMFKLASSLAETGLLEEAGWVIQQLERAAQEDDSLLDPLGRAYANVTIDAVSWESKVFAWQLAGRFLEQAVQSPQLARFSSVLVDGVKAAPSAEHAQELFLSAIRLLDNVPLDPRVGRQFAALASNAANRAQRDGKSQIALRTFETILELAERLEPGVLPPDLVARVSIPAGTGVASIPAQATTGLIRRLEELAGRDKYDEEARSNCALGLYNILDTLLRMQDDEAHKNAVRAFDVMCRVCAWKPVLEDAKNYCLAGAYSLASRDPGGKNARHALQTLQRLLPNALAPRFLTSKEDQWGVDLSFFRS